MIKIDKLHDECTYYEDVGTPYCPDCGSLYVKQDSDSHPFFMSGDTNIIDVFIPLNCGACGYAFSIQIYFNDIF